MSAVSKRCANAGSPHPHPTVVLISRGVTSLRIADCRTSSTVFEVGLAEALSKDHRVVVISFAFQGSQVKGNFELVGATGRSRFLSPNFARVLLRRHPDRIIFFGYSPVALVALKILSKCVSAKLVAYVFDTHAGAIECKASMRRNLIDWYFKVGERLLRIADGVVLLNPRARAALGLEAARCLVSRVGVLPSGSICRTTPSSQHFRVVYAGSLESYNGILELLEAMAHIQSDLVKLDILGAGRLEDAVKRTADMDRRITYYGPMPRSVVDEVVAHADLLVSLRDTDHPVAAFSFPSKLVEYLGSGTPVLSSPIEGVTRLHEMATVVRELDPPAIAQAVLSVRDDPEGREAKAAAARDYVARHHSWPMIAREFSSYLDRL